MQRYAYNVVGGAPMPWGAPAPVPKPTNDIAALCRAVAPDDGREHLIAFALDARLNVVGYQVVASGTVDAVMLYPRDVYCWGLLVPTARYVALAHNHPSGDVEPSGPDVKGTLVVAAAGQLIGLDLAWAIVFTHRSGAWREIKPQGQARPAPGGEDAEPKRPEAVAPPDDDEAEAEPGETPEDTPGDDEGEDGAPNEADGDEGGDEGDGADADKDGAEVGQDDAGEAIGTPTGAQVGNADPVSLDDVRAAMRRLLKRGA